MIERYQARELFQYHQTSIGLFHWYAKEDSAIFGGKNQWMDLKPCGKLIKYLKRSMLVVIRSQVSHIITWTRALSLMTISKYPGFLLQLTEIEDDNSIWFWKKYLYDQANILFDIFDTFRWCWWCVVLLRSRIFGYLLWKYRTCCP